MANTLQQRPIAEPDNRIDLRCPHCAYTWNVATVLSGVWWGKGITPIQIARLCYCPYCHAAPPMEPAAPPPWPVIRWPYCTTCGRHITLREAATDAMCVDCRAEGELTP